MILSRFRDAQQFRLFTMLVLASFSCGLLVLGRMYMKRHELPDIDNLIPIVTESVQAYKVCQQRIDAVEKALAETLGDAGEAGSGASTSA